MMSCAAGQIKASHCILHVHYSLYQRHLMVTFIRHENRKCNDKNIKTNEQYSHLESLCMCTCNVSDLKLKLLHVT